MGGSILAIAGLAITVAGARMFLGGAMAGIGLIVTAIVVALR